MGKRPGAGKKDHCDLHTEDGLPDIRLDFLGCRYVPHPSEEENGVCRPLNAPEGPGDALRSVRPERAHRWQQPCHDELATDPDRRCEDVEREADRLGGGCESGKDHVRQSGRLGAKGVGSMPDFELDLDTTLSPLGDGRYSGRLVERWNVGIGMNGGYLAAFCLRAVLASSPLPDPLTMTIHYLSRPEAGDVEVQVTPMREGRGHATYRFDLLQGDGDETVIRVTGLVLTGRLRAAGPLDFVPAPPDVALPEASSAVKPMSAGSEAVALWGRLEQRVAKADDVFFLRTEPGEARTGGWTRLADGRPADALCVPLFLDCWPPAVFSRTMKPDGAGAPTLELTVHWRNRVDPGWLYARFVSDQLAGGYVDEKGELWSSGGVLVAESRQLARYVGDRGETS